MPSPCQLQNQLDPMIPLMEPWPSSSLKQVLLLEPRHVQTHQTWVNLQRLPRSLRRFETCISDLGMYIDQMWSVIFNHHTFLLLQSHHKNPHFPEQRVNQPRQVSCPGSFTVCCSWASNWQPEGGWRHPSFVYLHHCKHVSKYEE